MSVWQRLRDRREQTSGPTAAERPGGPLAGLADTDWAAVDHAYGPAIDVPGQLRAVAVGPAAARTKAIWELWGNVHHQGTVYAASAPTVPFLARLARYEPVPPADRLQLIHLLAAIAAGSSYLDVHEPLLRCGLTPGDKATRDREIADVQRAHEAVAAVAPELLEPWPNDPAHAWSLVLLAGQVPEVATPVRDRVATMPTTDPRDSAPVALALARIDRTVTWEGLADIATIDDELSGMANRNEWASADIAAASMLTVTIEALMERYALGV
jgi:hypothetical protein